MNVSVLCLFLPQVLVSGLPAGALPLASNTAEGKNNGLQSFAGKLVYKLCDFGMSRFYDSVGLSDSGSGGGSSGGSYAGPFTARPSLTAGIGTPLVRACTQKG